MTIEGKALSKLMPGLPSSFWQIDRRDFKREFHRLSRATHAYLSAFAFVTLIFFSLSGLFLNHPEWFAVNDAEETAYTETLKHEDLELALAAPDPGKALATLLMQQAPIIGAFQSAELFSDEGYLRFAGAKGTTDATVNLETGDAEILQRSAGAIELLGNLHRGKESGIAWKFMIDISAILILVLSLAGFFLFFLIRFRAKTSARLIMASILAIGVLVVFYVP